MAKRKPPQRAHGFNRETAATHGRSGGKAVHVVKRKAMRAIKRTKPKTSQR